MKVVSLFLCLALLAALSFQGGRYFEQAKLKSESSEIIEETEVANSNEPADHLEVSDKNGGADKEFPSDDPRNEHYQREMFKLSKAIENGDLYGDARSRAVSALQEYKLKCATVSIEEFAFIRAEYYQNLRSLFQGFEQYEKVNPEHYRSIVQIGGAEGAEKLFHGFANRKIMGYLGRIDDSGYVPWNYIMPRVAWEEFGISHKLSDQAFYRYVQENFDEVIEPDKATLAEIYERQEKLREWDRMRDQTLEDINKATLYRLTQLQSSSSDSGSKTLSSMRELIKTFLLIQFESTGEEERFMKLRGADSELLRTDLPSLRDWYANNHFDGVGNGNDKKFIAKIKSFLTQQKKDADLVEEKRRR